MLPRITELLHLYHTVPHDLTPMRPLHPVFLHTH